MTYQFNSYVNRKEVETLKEMIFQRARERAKSMTGDVQADVMSIARESFESNENPFAKLTAPVITDEPEEAVTQPANDKNEITPLHEYVEAVEAQTQEQEIGFTQKSPVNAVANQNRVIQDQASARQIQNTMMEAREGLTNKKSFMGALAFLNSQAAVSLLNKRTGSGVDIVA